MTKPGTSRSAPVQVSEKRLSVVHVTMTTATAYAQVAGFIESHLGRFTDHIRELAEEHRTAQLRAELVRIAGRYGLALHYTAGHGQLLQLEGAERPVVTYHIGNVLLAEQMTKVDFAAGLYAPLRVVIYGNDQGGTTLEYDKPSSLFGQFHDPGIDAVAAPLDTRLATLLRAAAT